MTGKHHPSEVPTPPKPPISIKGREDGLRVAVEAAPADELERVLEQQLQRRARAFFAGAPVVLQLPGDRLDLHLAARLAAVIEKAGMTVVAVVSSSRGPDQPLASPERARRRPVELPPAAGGGGLVVTGTVRSGQRIVSDGSVVVLGDVNPGGEVRAGGSVVVWGRLRGIVEAGQAGRGEQGDRAAAVVCALDLAPTQLRIGDALARAPEETDRVPVPEVARESDGRILVEAWR